MKFKNTIFCLIILVTISLSLGVVCAGDNLSSMHPQLLSVEESPIVVESEPVEIDNDVSTIEKKNDELLSANEYSSSKSSNFTYSSSNNHSLLGKNGGDVLGETRTPNGNYFQNISDLIAVSSSGDTIDLGGKTYLGTGSQIVIDKDITIIGSSSGGSAILNPNQLSRVFEIQNGCNVTISNVIFENLQSGINGPAIYYKGNGNLQLDDCTVRNSNINSNSALDGCAITADTYSKIVLNNFKYYNNIVRADEVHGAALRTYRYSTITVNGFEAFENNIKGNNVYGGLIFIGSDSNANLKDVINRNNNISADSWIRGGIINVYSQTNDAKLTLNNVVNYQNNIAGGVIDGGFVNVQQGGIAEFNINKFNCTENIISAVTSIQGGSIRALYATKFDFNDLTYVNNSAFWDYQKDVNPFDHAVRYSPGFILIGNKGIIKDAHFEDNSYNAALGVAIQIIPDSLSSPIIIEECKFINTTGQSSALDSGRTSDVEHGGAICVNEDKNGGAAIIRNCLFVNNVNAQGGAITPHNHCLIENCRFFNNTATKYYGGAISTNYGLDHNNANITIKDCYFEGNSAPVGGAIQARGEYISIFNSTFINNSAIKGGAVFIEGNTTKIIDCNFSGNDATHDLGKNVLNTPAHLVDYGVISDYKANGGAIYIDGSKAYLKNNRFLDNSAIHIRDAVEEGKGGAVYIKGDDNLIVDSYFDDNFAHSGNGSAVYVSGENGTISNSQFYNHDSHRGTVYVWGDDFTISDSIFKHNTAAFGGAGLYMEGDNSFVNNTLFEDNNASIHGGAIHTHGDNIRIWNSNFVSNNAHPDEADHNQGLGGAIYIRGDNNEISFSRFIGNTARNGSAVYNKGANLYFDDDEFVHNQAYSYLLITIATPAKAYYNGSNQVLINVTHVGGDNIINAIHNDGPCTDVSFFNVTYEHSIERKNTGKVRITPVASIESSNGGELLYQDPREDNQDLHIRIEKEDYVSPGLLGAPNNVLLEGDYKTGLYGNVTFLLKEGLGVGKYDVYAEHNEDNFYKAISNKTQFEIVPDADLGIVKIVSDKNPKLGDEITWTLIVTNNGPLDAEGVYVIDTLPKGLIYVSDDSNGKYNKNSGRWDIGDLAVNKSATLKIITKINITGDILNTAVVNSSTPDSNESNNEANNTTHVDPAADLEVIKLVSTKYYKYGEEVTWTIIVINHGPDRAVNVVVEDTLPKGLSVKDYKVSRGTFNKDTLKWEIDGMDVGETQQLNITTVINQNVTVINKVNVTNDVYDPNETNNNANNTTDPVNADVGIVKIVSHKTSRIGDIITWTLVVTNYGPCDAEGVQVKDALPNGLIYVSDDSNGKYDNSKGIWTIDDLANGAKATLKIRTVVNRIGTIINTATVNSTTPDYNESNNKGENDTKVEPFADLELIKKVNIKKVKVGDKVIWTITVINHGPDKAINAKVFDVLPRGLKLIGFSVSKGKFNPSTGEWDIGDMDVNETVTLKLTTRALITGTIVNTAKVQSDSEDPNMENNDDSDEIEVEKDFGIIITEGPDGPVYNSKDPNNGSQAKAMHATGNPIIMVLLALLAVCGVGLRKRF